MQRGGQERGRGAIRRSPGVDLDDGLPDRTRLGRIQRVDERRQVVAREIDVGVGDDTARRRGVLRDHGQQLGGFAVRARGVHHERRGVEPSRLQTRRDPGGDGERRVIRPIDGEPDRDPLRPPSLGGRAQGGFQPIGRPGAGPDQEHRARPPRRPVERRGVGQMTRGGPGSANRTQPRDERCGPEERAPEPEQRDQSDQREQRDQRDHAHRPDSVWVRKPSNARTHRVRNRTRSTDSWIARMPVGDSTSVRL